MAKKNKRLGGWLIVILIAFSLSIISFLFMIKTFLPFVTGNLQAFILTIVYCILTFLFSYSLVLMIQKKKISKKIAIFSLWIGFIVYITIVIVSRWGILLSLRFDYLTIGNIIFNGLMSFVITEYFLHSKRVKNTFIK